MKVKLIVQPYKTTLETPSQVLKNRVAECLTYVDRSASYLNYQRGFNYLNPYHCLLERDQFYTGLLEHVEDRLVAANAQVEKIYQWQEVTPQRRPLPDWLYPHQQRIIETMLSNNRGVIEAPTGSGKTIAAAYFLDQFRHVKVLFTVPEVSLMYKTAEVFAEIFGEPIGKVGDGKRIFERVTVGVINSLAKIAKTKPELLKDVKVILHDEAHRAATSYYDALTSVTEAYWIYGLTATAFREGGDTLKMTGLCGPLRLKIHEQNLARQQVILKPKYFFVSNMPPFHQVYSGAVFKNNQPVYHTPNGKPDLREVYQKAIVENTHRNKFIVQCLEAFIANPNRKGGALILVERIEHGVTLQQMLNGIPFLSGKNSPEERKEILDGLRNRTLDAAIATSIFNEGQDIPSLELVIIAGGGTNKRRVLQQVGRVVRTCEGKTHAIVVDFYDNEPYYLRAQASSRRTAVVQRYGECIRFVPLQNLLDFLNTYA